MDIFEKCRNYSTARDVQSIGLYPYFIPLSESEGSVAKYNGKSLIMCGSNNYLGLTTHPEVQEASREAISRFGSSCTGSRFLNGTLELHEDLETELADWVQKDQALVFSTGMQVNLGVISSLVGRNDYVILDRDDHASIVDGARLSFGSMIRFRHNDISDLEGKLSRLPTDAGKLLVIDGLYSMEGDIASLPEIVPLCKKFNTRIMIDDAHAVGVLGGGRGTAAHFGLTDDVDLIMGTFSKSFASCGGYIAGDEEVIHYVKHNARSLIFSASIPGPNAAAALAALNIMKREPERIERLNQIGLTMRREFKNLGFDIGNSETPVIPIIIGDDLLTLKTWKQLFDNGVFVNPILSPATPPGRQLLRTSYMATHTDEQIDQVLTIFEKVGKELGLI
ncbi:MAG: aminotransferase class I/II-fold pyridoxal phosphate-dependent enzyme [Anaerolineales bacterium]|nr:aminotransferase class I/II-fold pyridoxal phosphate-dependent enzyme [Anaerolineales bacterium]